jgi:hypothetical protein
MYVRARVSDLAFTYNFPALDPSLVLYYPMDSSANVGGGFKTANFASRLPVYDASLAGSSMISYAPNNSVTSFGDLSLNNTMGAQLVAQTTSGNYVVANNTFVPNISGGFSISLWFSCSGQLNKMGTLINLPRSAGANGLEIDVSGTNMICSGYIIIPPFAPTAFSRLILWLDAADAATFSYSANAITWSDKSGLGHNATSTYTGIGTYITRTAAPGASSYSTILFSNTTASGNTNISLKWTFTPTFVFPITICFVFDAKTKPNSDGFWFLSNYFLPSGGNQSLRTLQIYTANTSLTIELGEAFGGLAKNSGTFSLSTLNMITIQVYKIGSTYYFINNLNGTINTTYTSYTGTSAVLDQTFGLIMVGGNCEVGVSEYLIYNNNQLTQAQYQKVEGYLAHKWGINGSLPSGHPYKSAAPSA